MFGISENPRASSPLDAVIVGILDEVLAELKTISARQASSGTSKVEVKTSTRGADVTVTVYVQTDQTELESAGNQAVAEYRRVMRMLADETMAAFVAEANKIR